YMPHLYVTTTQHPRMSKDLVANVPQFDGSNWIQWEPLMKAYLKFSSVWHFVESPRQRPVEPLFHILENAPIIREALEPLPDTADNTERQARALYNAARSA